MSIFVNLGTHMMLSATLTLEKAASRCWDVVIVGAGPAGALAAHELARAGASVLVVDKAGFPRWKVCGCCLNGRALTTLKQAGLGHLPAKLGALSLRSVVLASRGRQACVPLIEGIAVSREAFDASLIGAAITSGAAFLSQTRAALGEVGGAARQVLLRDGAQAVAVSGKIVLAADGLGGRLSAGLENDRGVMEKNSWIGAGVVAPFGPAFYGPHTIFMACGRGGYVGLVRLEDGRLDVAAAFDPVLVKRMHHVGLAARAILKEAGFPELAGLERLPWRGTPSLTRTAPRIARERLFVVGDAAGYVQPFTGEGIGWALAAARALCPLVWRGIRGWDPRLEAAWRGIFDQTITRRQGTCRALMTMLRRPGLTAGVTALLARVPGLAAPIVRRINA
jgi:flavin-dependent dehydrogenase